MVTLHNSITMQNCLECLQVNSMTSEVHTSSPSPKGALTQPLYGPILQFLTVT